MAGVRWNKVCLPAKDLVKKLLKALPQDRLTAEMVARHPWVARVRSGQHVDPDVQDEVLGNLMTFQNQNILVQLCITAVARQMDTQDLTSIYSTFRKLDTNGDGILSFEEVAAGWRSLHQGEPQEHVEQLQAELQKSFMHADLDSSGGLDYTEPSEEDCKAPEKRAERAWSFVHSDMDGKYEALQNIAEAPSP